MARYLVMKRDNAIAVAKPSKTQQQNAKPLYIKFC